MKPKLFQTKLEVRKSPTHGYGVFAGKTIKKGEKIEECYFIITRGKDKVLEDYYFEANGKDALLTGYGIIYNHSDNENADYFINVKRRVATIKAVKNIKKGEEIFVCYGTEWFSSRGKKAKENAAVKSKTKKKTKTTKKTKAKPKSKTKKQVKRRRKSAR